MMTNCIKEYPEILSLDNIKSMIISLQLHILSEFIKYVMWTKKITLFETLLIIIEIYLILKLRSLKLYQ